MAGSGLEAEAPPFVFGFAGILHNPPSWVEAMGLNGVWFLGRPRRQVLHGGAYD